MPPSLTVGDRGIGITGQNGCGAAYRQGHDHEVSDNDRGATEPAHQVGYRAATPALPSRVPPMGFGDDPLRPITQGGSIPDVV